MDIAALGIIEGLPLKTVERIDKSSQPHTCYLTKKDKGTPVVATAKRDLNGGIIFETAIFIRNDIINHSNYMPKSAVQKALAKHKGMGILLPLMAQSVATFYKENH